MAQNSAAGEIRTALNVVKKFWNDAHDNAVTRSRLGFHCDFGSNRWCELIKTPRASDTDSVPSAEFLRPLNGSVFGHAWQLAVQVWIAPYLVSQDINQTHLWQQGHCQIFTQLWQIRFPNITNHLGSSLNATTGITVQTVLPW